MTGTLGASNLKNFLNFDRKIDYMLWANKDMFQVLEGAVEPRNTAEESNWKKENDDRFSIYFLTTSETVANMVRGHQLKAGEGLGNREKSSYCRRFARCLCAHDVERVEIPTLPQLFIVELAL